MSVLCNKKTVAQEAANIAPNLKPSEYIKQIRAQLDSLKNVRDTPADYILVDHDNLEAGEDLDFTPSRCDVQDIESVIEDVRSQYKRKGDSPI